MVLAFEEAMNPIDKFLLEYLTQPVPQKLVELFSIQSKTELIKFTHKLSVSKSEMVTLHLNSLRIGYKHFTLSGETIPNHLKPTKKQEEAFNAQAPTGKLDKLGTKYVSKMINLFDERDFRVGHLYVGYMKWHLFHFGLKDIDEETNHWTEGSHIHFTNYLVSPLSISDVSEKFTNLDFDMGKRIHIKYSNQAAHTTPAIAPR